MNIINVVSSGGRYDALIAHFRSVLLNTGTQVLRFSPTLREEIEKCKQTATGGVIHLNEIYSLWQEMRLQRKIIIPQRQYTAFICIVGDSDPQEYNDFASLLTRRRVEFISYGSSVLLNLVFLLFTFS